MLEGCNRGRDNLNLHWKNAVKGRFEMTDDSILMQRVRINLAQAGIPAPDEDLDEMRDRGVLNEIEGFEEYARTVPADTVPGFLASWGEDVQIEAGVPGGSGRDVAPGTFFSAPEGDSDPTGTRYASIVDVAGMLKRRDISSVELTHQAIERISDRDPMLNAFQSVLSEHALKAARKADQELEAGIELGPLHGVPIAAKDLLAMRGTITTAGSLIHAGRRTNYDADVIERLEAAGAIIVGKTRMSEFAFSPGSNNEHYGPTRNPWNLEHDTGGSSSGSAAAVADGLVYGALGSDTGGSIRIPAALCGIVGFKPTFGRISLYGADSLAWTLDHHGPLTRTVVDAALMMNVLAGYDPRDSRTRRVPVPDYTAGLHDSVRGLRIGVLTNDGSLGALATDEAVESWHRSLRMLRDQGAELVDVSLPEMQPLRLTNGAIVRNEAAAFHEATLVTHFEQYSRFMRQRVMSAYAASPVAYMRTSQARAVLRRACQRIWKEIDILCTPAMPYEAPALGDPGRNTTFSGPFNTLGWPAAVVPISLSGKRLPLSTQLIGKPWDDALVLRVASAMEAGRGSVR
jgi:Asp-tRNA(Asn)/Glu-tRNA(Gln) amidotransferase A subunit family amidase